MELISFNFIYELFFFSYSLLLAWNCRKPFKSSIWLRSYLKRVLAPLEIERKKNFPCLPRCYCHHLKIVLSWEVHADEISKYHQRRRNFFKEIVQQGSICLRSVVLDFFVIFFLCFFLSISVYSRTIVTSLIFFLCFSILTLHSFEFEPIPLWS